MDKEIKQHGGKRAGAGNFSPYKEKTTVVNFRCPVSKVEDFKAFCKEKLKQYEQKQ